MESSPVAPPRRALLVFADALARDLGRRGWSRPFRPLLETGAALSSPTVGWDVHRFTLASPGPGNARVHRQEGATFAERLENAVARLASMGYGQIVIVGRDCPGLGMDDVRLAFDALERPGCRLVLGPDHRGGTYLIGLHAGDHRALLGGVRWQRDTDFAELRGRVAPGAAAVLGVKQDLDTWADLRLLARSDAVTARWRELAARLLAACQDFTDALRNAAPRVDSFRRARRLRWQLPPPFGARALPGPA